MDKFLDTLDHSKLNQEGIKHLKGPTIYNQIEGSIKNFSKNKSSGDF
jgi:hypothetical protein